MGLGVRVRWSCPNGCSAVLGARRPRRDDVARYCLPCSAKKGRLVERTAPALEAHRAEKSAKAKARTRERAERAKAKETASFTVAGVDLRAEMDKVFRSKAAAEAARRGRGSWVIGGRPNLRVRRMTYYPRSRLGWARGASVICIFDYPGITPEDVRETLTHEVAHAVCKAGEHHGIAFKSALRTMMEEVYGVRPRLEHRYHGESSRLMKEAAESPAPASETP